MSVQVASNNFTSQSVLFQNYAEAEAWRQSLTVPSATTTVEGVVKKAAAQANFAVTSTITTVTLSVLQADGSYTNTDVISSATAAQIITNQNNIVTQLNALLDKLRAAGVIAS